MVRLAEMVDKVIHKRFGERVRELRQARGLSQEELAFKAGVHRTYISLLERNIKSPTLDVLFRICKALDVKPSRLVSRLEDKV